MYHLKVRYSKYLMLSWQLHRTTRETPYKNIFNMAAIVMDDISSDSGIFCDSKLYHSYFRYNISFIDPSLAGFGEIFPEVMIFSEGSSAESPSLRVYKW